MDIELIKTVGQVAGIAGIALGVFLLLEGHRQAQSWMRLGDIEQDRQQHAAAEGNRHVDAEPPAEDPVGGGQSGFHRGDFIDGGGAGREIGLAIDCQFIEPGRSVEELESKSLLQAGDALANRGLGDPQALGCLCGRPRRIPLSLKGDRTPSSRHPHSSAQFYTESPINYFYDNQATVQSAPGPASRFSSASWGMSTELEEAGICRLFE